MVGKDMDIRRQLKKLLNQNTIESYLKSISLINEYYESLDAEHGDNSDDFERHHTIYSTVSQIVSVCKGKDDDKNLELQDALAVAIIKIITSSEIDRNNSLFKKYFKMLNLLSPKILTKVSEVEGYIKSLWKSLYKEDIFVADSLEGVGRIIYEKVKSKTGCDDNTLKIAIQILHLYPFNDRSKPVTDEEYYKEIVAYLGINHLPLTAYTIAKEMFIQVQDAFEELLVRINALEEKCDELLKDSEDRSNKIKKKQGRKIFSDNLREDRISLLSELQRRKELESLYRKKERLDSNEDKVADSYLEYCKLSLQETFALFIDKSKSSNETDETLRQWVLMDVRRDDKGESLINTAYKIEEHFKPYFQIITQFNNLIDDDPMKTICRMRIRVKSFLFMNDITKRHKRLSGTKLIDESSDEYKSYLEEIEEHPLYVEKLMAINDSKEYLIQLKKVVNDAIDMINRNIRQSLCLKKRKKMLDKIISLFKSEDYDVVVNIIPIQIEGIFADFLENSLVFKSESNISSYEQIYKSVLMEKAKIIVTNDLNLGFDTIGYFKYYFNSFYRNTVAHGNYSLLFNGGTGFYNQNEEQAVEIVAHDLILDLNYIVDVVAKSNELDEAERYLKWTEESLRDCASVYTGVKKEEGMSIEEVTAETETSEVSNLDSRYERLFLDLLGESRYNSRNYLCGFFISYDPVQLLFWIFNPFIEAEVGKSVCEPIRETLLSCEFWGYVVKKLKRGLVINDGHTLGTVINLLMPIIKKNDSVFKLASEANEIIKTLQKP